MSLQYDELPFHAGQEDITLTLDPAGSVTGKVVVRGTGQPLANAVVGLATGDAERWDFFCSTWEQMCPRRMDHFRFLTFPPVLIRSWRILPTNPSPTGLRIRFRSRLPPARPCPTCRLQAYKGGVVEVTVRGKNNHEPLADAGVSVNSEDYNRGGSTGTNGVAYFRLPPGQFSVFANKQDWSQAQAQTTVTDGQTTSVTIELGAPFKVTGIVRDASGAPVAGASVGVFPDYGGGDTGAKTDANGHYELSWQKPAWAGIAEPEFLSARAPFGAKARGHAGNGRDNDQPGCDFETGDERVRSACRIPTAKRSQTWWLIFHFNWKTRVLRSAVSPFIPMNRAASRRKRCRWESVTAGMFPPVVMAAPSRRWMRRIRRRIIMIFLRSSSSIADRKLAGRVLGTNGTPVAGAQIWMNGEGQPNGNAITDADGRFVFDAVCEGAVTVSANMKGAYGSAQAMGGDTNVVIRFDARNRVYMPAAPQTLTGTVYDSSGNPAVGASVVVTPNWGHDGYRQDRCQRRIFRQLAGAARNARREIFRHRARCRTEPCRD